MTRVRWNDPPAARYVHPRAIGLSEQDGDHDFNLDVAEDAAPNYLRWIAELCGPHLGRSLLEIGAGTGSLTALLAPGRRVLATDLSEACVAALRARFDGVDAVRVARADIRSWDPDEVFDTVLMVNVLEHVRDDVGALARTRSFVRPGGSLVVYVPALNGLYGRWDRRAGHFRRYSRWRLERVFREAGLTPVELRYANLLAVPAWLLFAQVSRVDSGGGASLRLWDRTAVPLTRLLERRLRVPVGLNLLGVARAATG